MRAKHFIQQTVTMLVMLVATASPALAWETEWNPYDDGGGNYIYRCEKEDYGPELGWHASNLYAFKTEKTLNYENEQLSWDFSFRILNDAIYVYNVDFEGEVYLVCEDGSRRKFGTWSKSRNGSLTRTSVDDYFGNFTIKNQSDQHWVTLQYWPSGQAKYIKVSKIIVKWHFIYRNNTDCGWMEYEKDLDFSPFVANDYPLPPLTAEWNEDGKVVLKASDLLDKRQSSVYEDPGYNMTYWFTGSGVNRSFKIVNDERMTITPKGNGRIDATVTFTPTAPFTSAFHCEYERIFDAKMTGTRYPTETFLQCGGTHTTLKPFTSPRAVNVVFDKWQKRNTVTWEQVERRNVYFITVDCRYDGTWYVLRYESGKGISTSKVVGSLAGDENATLELVDSDPELEYDKEYVYRVVFLPSLVVNKYKDQLASMPSGMSGLWTEKVASTKLEQPIKLWQDRTYETAVRLKWEYCIQPSGQIWTIEYRPAGSTDSWRTLDNSLNVDPDQSEAFFDANGSVCDMVEYRVRTSYAGKEFYSNVLTGNLPAGSYISEVKASTGTEEKTVIVKWKVERADPNNEIHYRVLRRVMGETEWTLLTDEIHGKASEYTYTDDRPLAGNYYEYSVQAYGAKCDEQLVKTDEVVAPGFSQARGTITGHISYGTGTSVADVKVSLVKTTSDDYSQQPQFLSRYLEGEGKGLLWRADSTKYAKALNGQQPLTVQFWAKPSDGVTESQSLFYLKNALELGVKWGNGTYYLYAIDNSKGGTAVTDFPALTFDKSDFTHVAATYDGGTWTFYVGTDSLVSATMTAAATDWNACPKAGEPTLSMGGSNRVGAKAFTGNVDDVRLWKRVLSKKELSANYTRILGGTEDDLMLYWPLDEGLGVVDYAFDVARQDGIYQLNHPEVGVNARPSATVPRHLGLYGVTDANGNYIIRGIPFQQGGTNYEIVPLYGVHNFKPNTRSMFVSPTSLTANNIDFEDVSSFPMEGYVYYAGTNIPVEGIQMYVDGQILTTDGQVQQTDANGHYQISVPIGQHYVEAKLGGHTMVAGGRFPTEGRYNFTSPVNYTFTDSTLVNFVGRVGGGERNDTLSVGFGASNNNIGVATVTLQLNNESYSFNCQDDHISDATADRTWQSDTTAINSKAWTGRASSSHYIFIDTDPQTGEFSAMLPPLKYVTKSIVVKNNPDVEFTSLPEIDLSNPLKELTDSLRLPTEQGDSTWRYYKYNTKLVRTHYAQPQVDLSQPRSGKGVYGMQEYKGEDALGKFTVSDLWENQEDGSVKYRFGFPIYEMDKQYQMKVRGYEVYKNFDSGTAVSDTIPLVGQVLTISNEMSNAQEIICAVEDANSEYKPGQVYDLKVNQLVLDSLGCYTFKWRTGAPNVTAPYTRHLGVTMVRNKRTYVPAGLDAVVVGDLPMGNNFVTKGPDHITMVLRDPPGSKSKTIWKTGSVTTKTKTTANGGYGDEKTSYSFSAGLKTETHVGIGVSTLLSSAETSFDTSDGLHYKWSKESSNETVVTTTATEQISTSSGDAYVGSKGDTYIGYSTNLLVGTCRKVGFFRDTETSPFSLKDDVTLCLGDSLETTFMYSAYEIENVMIPKWEDSRNGYLTQHYNTKEEAEAFVNNTSEPIYVTWLKKDDPNYGQNDTYLQVTPKAWETDGKNHADEDMIMWCNNQIRLWKQAMADNEEDKVKAMEGRNKWDKNISFDGGTSYTYTSRNDTTSTSKTTYSHNLGYVCKFGYSSSESMALSLKHTFSLDTENGWSRLELDSEKDGGFAEFDYIFEDGNRDTDFSVDIFKSTHGWSDIFSVFGGQSYNPYEAPEYTKYYMDENGKPYQLSNGTVQMEQPDIQISIDGNVAAESAVLTDVPSGESGQFTLHLTNNTVTNQGRDFTYKLSVAEGTNQKGLQILMDGVPMEGRGVFVPAGQTVKKTITVRQTDQSVLDYENIELWFSSSYQAIKIHDIAKLSVHFKPSSSPVSLTVTNPVLNTDETTGNGKLQLKLSKFNRQFKNLKNLGVEYRFAGSTQWKTLHTWVTNPDDSTNTSFSVLPPTGDLRLTVDMLNNISYPEGNYEFRAFSTTPYGTENVVVYSEVIPVIKDMTKPRNLFIPSPANGILGPGDELAVEFNEDIVPGYVGDKNVIVTAKLNHQPINHEVSVHLSRRGGGASTVNPLFLRGDFSTDFWLNRETGGAILQIGRGSNEFSLSFDEQGHVYVRIAGSNLTSKSTVPADVWVYYVLSYKESDHTINMLAQWSDENGEDKNVMLFENEPVPQKTIEAIRYTNDSHLYLGPITAKIHDLSLFNIYRDVNMAAATKYQAKDNYIYGLVNFWPMNEGHGDVVADMRHTHDIELGDSWAIENTNYMLYTDSAETQEIDITRANISQGDSYAIEMWTHINVDPKGEATLFETGSMPENRLRLYYDKEMNLRLDYGRNTATVASYENFPMSGGTRHMALNVVRGQAASFYLDGQRTAVIAEADVPMFTGATMKIGQGFDGFIDEIRVWKATVSEDRLLSNMYNTLDTADVYSRGLVIYYPFEKNGKVNGADTKVKTFENMAPVDNPQSQLSQDEDKLLTTNFPLKNKPDETRLIASPVASERKVVINLSDVGISPRDIEGTALNLTLDGVRDLHGNTSEPIKWTAYVKQNTLEWKRDSVNIIKKYGEPYTFDVDIENKSGNAEYYTLYNMPQWLSLVDSERADDVQALKSKTLRFEVNPLVAVGNYDVTIGLQGNKEILEPLRIVMKVHGEKPDWKVDPTKYDHNMNIIGQVYINGILMENSESMVAAFINGECRGVASPTKVRDAAYITLSVYGNDYKAKDQNSPVSFRIWDASKGVAYTEAQIAIDGSPIDVTFEQDKMIGDFDKPAIWTKSDKVEQLIPIHENWNWIAFGVEPQSTYLDHIFSEYAEWMLLIKNRTAFSDYNGAEWNGTLVPTANAMYKLRVSRLPITKQEAPNSQLALSGHQPALSDMPVTLRQGWNWIAYTPLNTMTIEEALAGADPQSGDIVKSQTGVSIYGPYGWEGNLQSLEGGHGYMYYSVDKSEKQFVYPTISTMSVKRMAPRRAAAGGLHVFSPVDANLYPNNMTMVIKLTDGEAVVDTAEVAAFVGDECRGATRAEANGLYYLVIAGEGSGHPMTLRTCIDGEIITIDNTQQFVSDDNVGTSWEPYVIDLQNLSDGINNLMGGDAADSDWWSLQGIKIGRRPTQPGIYIHRGEKVTIKPKK